MNIGQFRIGLTMPERLMLGRLGRIERLSKVENGRTSYEIDAIEERASVALVQKATSPPRNEAYAIVRIVTTARRFRQVLGSNPREGDWILFRTRSRGVIKTWDSLPAWQVQLTEGGYTDLSRGYVAGLDLVDRQGEPMPASLGAGSPKAAKRARVRSIAPFPRSAIKPPHQIRKRLGNLTASKIQVRDVGQASFVTLLDDQDAPIAHFDAGWPLGFNYKGAPTADPGNIGTTAPVILSHWDWDHLHAYHRLPDLASCTWVTPVQDLGPGALKVAKELNAKGLLLGLNRSIARPGALVGICRGPTGNPNQTGLAMRVALTSGNCALLVGDADYQHVPLRLRAAPVNGLVVTHHGADFDGMPPAPMTPQDPAIISVGNANVYRHPRPDAIAKHIGQNWNVLRTDKTSLSKRGDRWLS